MSASEPPIKPKIPQPEPATSPSGGSIFAAPARGLSTFLLLAATAVMLPLLFPPFYCFFLAPVALVPFCVCVLRRPLNKKNLLFYYLLGVAFFLPNLFWIAPVTIGGFIALGLFVALYFPLFAIGLHRLVIQFRLPATIAVPLVWTAVEYIRATCVEGGFPWFLLGNCLAPVPALLQTADLFGVWGLTFFIALLNGFFVDVLRLPLRQVVGGKSRFSPAISALTTGVIVLAALVVGYGIFRLGQQTTHAGPRVAVVQANFSQSIKESGEHDDDIFRQHYELSAKAAAADPKPDIIAWPETMLPGFGNIEFLSAPDSAFARFGDAQEAAGWALLRDRTNQYFAMLSALADSRDVPLLIGVGSLDPRGTLNDSPKQNRTVLLAPKLGLVDYYAKRHLVPFGEYIPFRGLPLIGKYMILLSPISGFDYSNIPGNQWTRFVLPTSAYAGPPGGDGRMTAKDGTYTFATPICFEDAMPEPCRAMSVQFDAAGQAHKTDFLINVSNDGWFFSVELSQHLQACQIRAVENRIPIARAVNTGNSGFIDSDGRIVDLVGGMHGSLGAVGTLAENLQIDSRVTPFSRIGDLLPITCGIVAGLLVALTFVRPRRRSAQ